jgi:hypothetical protein
VQDSRTGPIFGDRTPPAGTYCTADSACGSLQPSVPTENSFYLRGHAPELKGEEGICRRALTGFSTLSCSINHTRVLHRTTATRPRQRQIRAGSANTPEPTPSSVPEHASPPAPAITRTNPNKGALSSSFWIR